MHLIETLISSTIVAFSGASSLQIMALHVQTNLQDSRTQEIADRLEQELMTLEASLQTQGQPLIQQTDCRQATAELQRMLASHPVPSQFQMLLEPLAGGDGLKLQLSSAGHPWIRQRMYRPAALGLCSPPLPSIANLPTNPTSQSTSFTTSG